MLESIMASLIAIIIWDEMKVNKASGGLIKGFPKIATKGFRR